MKKYFFIAVAAVIALAACTKNNVETKAPKAISYNAVTAKNQVTKAIIETAFYAPTDPDFGIWGLYSEEDWATNHTANVWVGTDASTSAQISNTTQTAAGYWKNAANTDYWPLSGSLVFMGYSPYARVNTKAAISVTETNKATLTVTDFSSATGTWVDDLMYSDPVEKTENDTNYDPNGSNPTTYDGVPVVFHHALSQIIVKAKQHEAYTGYTLKVTDITLTIDDKATLTAKAVPGSAAAASWTEATTEATATILENGDDALTTSYVQKGNAILVIPQTLDASAGNGYDKLTVTYTLTRNGSTSTKTVNINLTAGDDHGTPTPTALTTLAANTKYILNLDISLEEILYSPDVEAWESASDTYYDVPADDTI